MSTHAVFFGSTTGNTETIAKQIAQQLDAKVFNVANCSSDELTKYDILIFGTSTWGIGDLQDDWESFLSDVEQADLTSKKVALFGLGDSEGYPDSFVDGMGTIYNAIKDKGCTLVGKVDPADYTYDASTAEVDGNFVGLPLDEDNESGKTDARIKNWLNSL